MSEDRHGGSKEPSANGSRCASARTSSACRPTSARRPKAGRLRHRHRSRTTLPSSTRPVPVPQPRSRQRPARRAAGRRCVAPPRTARTTRSIRTTRSVRHTAPLHSAGERSRTSKDRSPPVLSPARLPVPPRPRAAVSLALRAARGSGRHVPSTPVGGRGVSEDLGWSASTAVRMHGLEPDVGVREPLPASCVTSWLAPTCRSCHGRLPGSAPSCARERREVEERIHDPGGKAPRSPGHEAGGGGHACVVHHQPAATRVADRRDGRPWRRAAARLRRPDQMLEPPAWSGTSRTPGRRPRTLRARGA